MIAKLKKALEQKTCWEESVELISSAIVEIKALSKKLAEAKGEVARLKETGWYMYQCLSDYGRLSHPNAKKFTPDQKFKSFVLWSWEQVVSEAEQALKEKPE